MQLNIVFNCFTKINSAIDSNNFVSSLAFHFSYV